MPMSLFEQHYQTLQHLDNGVKIQIIEQLQKDVYQKSVDELLFLQSNSELGQSLVTEDKTDENWIENIFAIADKAFKESELNGVVLSNSDDRGWTRDEIYER
ncbi:hypothetical protein LP114_05100 [Moraxella bovis]|uniref:hypothetical protein n=1 Tax=Moraxella bovis TaxID=476 RepID=UPI0022268017|nr:hypothetical protein [Moraxella bovis]UYZ90451.1 hypothetical protein LP114_05100 [Moraxella bovis]UYZ94366.1 hypothetical protein LP121_10855 [Moraxella bovis]UZA25447.1 hypothetical protein LP117_03000 [Moraxella bovis]UZA29062.1 hypothetical protein LP097_08855 [Moraxella bovis]